MADGALTAHNLTQAFRRPCAALAGERRALETGTSPHHHRSTPCHSARALETGASPPPSLHAVSLRPYAHPGSVSERVKLRRCHPSGEPRRVLVGAVQAVER